MMMMMMMMRVHLERILLNWNSTRGRTMSKNSFIFWSL